MYEYVATVLRVIDGDTVDLSVRLGFDIVINLRFRLYGINAPETRGPSKLAGDEAAAFLRKHLPVGKEVLIRTYKDAKEKFGRYLAEIISDDQNINKLMVKTGHAVEYLP